VKRKTKIRTSVSDHRAEMLADIQDRRRRRALARSRRDKAKPTLYLVRFDARERDEVFRRFEHDVNALLLNAVPGDRVHVSIHSPGGSVTAYANAAHHIARIRAAGIRVVGFVDEVAASGGYMMACACDEIRANPMAFVGSIGVVAQMPIVSDGLDRLGIDVRVYTAGDRKRTVTPFERPKPEDEEAFQGKLADIHEGFRRHVREGRGDKVGDDLMNGDFFMAQDVVGPLVDRLQDEGSALHEAFVEGLSIRRVHSEVSKSFSLKRLFGFDGAAEAFADRLFERLLESRLGGIR
jgi:serine protease SohB